MTFKEIIESKNALSEIVEEVIQIRKWAKDYKQLLWDYLKISQKGQSWHNLGAALSLHEAFVKEGDMRKVDFSKFA